MTDSLWRWLDRHLDPPAEPPANVPAARWPRVRRKDDFLRPSPEEWARQLWERFDAGTRWWLRQHPDNASCPACQVVLDVEWARYLAEVHPDRDERASWGGDFTDSQVAHAAIGDCRCGYRLSGPAAAVHAVDELRRYLEGATE